MSRALPEGDSGDVKASGVRRPRLREGRSRGAPATPACSRAGVYWVAGRDGGCPHELFHRRRAPCPYGRGVAESSVRR
jgi:hypothetical protein